MNTRPMHGTLDRTEREILAEKAAVLARIAGEAERVHAELLSVGSALRAASDLQRPGLEATSLALRGRTLLYRGTSRSSATPSA